MVQSVSEEESMEPPKFMTDKLTRLLVVIRLGLNTLIIIS